MNSSDNRDAPQRVEQIRRLVQEYQRRREAGDSVTEDSLTCQHPHLMPELGDELRKAHLICDAADEALLAEWSEAEHQMDNTVRYQPDHNGDYASRADGSSSNENIDLDVGIPDRLGKYVVVELLDRGGQTDVYRAVDTMLKRDVVIKLNRDPLVAVRSAREVLIQQGRLVAQLEHPNLDRVYDVGFHKECPYLVMEYERGLNLSQHVKQQSLTASQKATLIAQVARAVSAAHAQGVVHRDIKPDNIMVSKQGQPKLIDFGMAWLRDAWTSGPAETGLVSGTPEYMAPEQARGESVDQRSDVFALGAVLYFLLVGEAPFSAASRREALQLAAGCDFDEGRLGRHGVPGALRRICNRAMQPDPADRYRTADDMAGHLERFAGRSRRHVYAAFGLAAVLLLSAVVWPLLPSGENVAKIDARQHEETEEAMRISVWQEDQHLDMLEAVPLHSGDDVQVTWRMPKGLYGTLFWFDTEGKLHELHKIKPDQTDETATLVWPEPGKSSVLVGPPGTEVIFLCASLLRSPSAQDIRAIVAEDGPWPALAGESFVEFGRGDVEVRGPRLRGPGAEFRDRSESGVRQRVQTVLGQLPEGFEIVRGVAFPHLEP